MVCLGDVGVGESSATCLSSRSGKRLKKTRKYDIITTPAERVEMAPLNEEDDDDEDSTVFDIKYRCGGRGGGEGGTAAARLPAGGRGEAHLRKPARPASILVLRPGV